MAQNKKKNKTAVTITSIVIAALLIAAVVFVIIWANGHKEDKPDDTAAPVVTVNPVESETQNVVVVTDSDTVDTEPVTDTEEITDTESDTEPDIPVDPEISVDHSRTTASSTLENGAVVTLDVDSPKVTSDSYGENVSKLNDLISSEIEEFKNSYALALSDPEAAIDGDGSYTVTYEVSRARYGTVSILLKFSVDNGGAHGSTRCEAINFDLGSGERITLDSVFSVERDTYVDFIKQYVLTEMRKDPDAYFSTEDGALDDSLDTEQFLITATGIRVFFQEYDIGPYTTGVPTFDIPYSEIVGLTAY